MTLKTRWRVYYVLIAVLVLGVFTTDFSAAQVKRDQKRSRHRDAVNQGEEHPPLP